MPVRFGDILTAFHSGKSEAQIDQERAQNALMRNEVARIPQANQAQDQALRAREQQLQAGEQDMATARRTNAQKLLAGRFSAIAQSQSPKQAAAAFLRGQEWQLAGRELGLPVEQFAIGAQDTDDVVRSQAMDWARALGAETGQQQGVARTWVNPETQTMWALSRSGQSYDTGVPASQFAMRTVEAGGAVMPFNPASGTVGQPISTASQEAAAAAERKRAEAEAVAGVVPADTRATAAAKAPRLAAAERRLNRVESASRALGAGGGPVEGRLRSFIGTPAAQELEAANAQLINELTALTRIPGVGSQSDLEQRLAQLQLPSAEQHPDVRARSIQELRAFINDLNSALSSVSGGQQPQSGGWTIEEVP